MTQLVPSREPVPFHGPCFAALPVLACNGALLPYEVSRRHSITSLIQADCLLDKTCAVADSTVGAISTASRFHPRTGSSGLFDFDG